MKPTKRKAFNFLRSYFDVLNELKEDQDKLAFLMSIIDKQFLGKDPEGLSFIPKLCYESQRHQIESSVKGWERMAKEALWSNPSTNPMTNPKEEKEEVQVEEEEEEQVEVQVVSKKADTDTFSSTPFNSFWDNYPKKIGREVAFQAFKWLTQIEKEKAIQCSLLEKTLFESNPKADKQFILNPARWLNEKRFNDADHFQSKMDPKQLKSRQAEIDRENMMIRIREKHGKPKT